MDENGSADTSCVKFLLSSTSTWVNEDNISRYGLLLAKYTSFLEQTRKIVKIEELESAGTENGENTCRYCGVGFTDLIAHLKTHRSKNHLKCNKCGRTFLKKRDLRHHLRRKHSSEKLESTDGVANSCNSAEFQHLNVPWTAFQSKSSSLWAFKCSECGKRFRTRGYLRNHARMHVNKNKASPSVNRTETIIDTTSLTSSTSTTPYECENCHKVFKSAQLLLEHIPTHSSVNQPRSVTNEMFIEKSDKSGVVFECGFCQRQFKSKGYLRFHLTTHSRQNLPSSRSNGKLVKCPENADTFQCMLCSTSVYSESELFDHMKRHPTADKHLVSETNDSHLTMSEKDSEETASLGSISYKCTICDKEFRTKGYLRNHIRTHGNAQTIDHHHDLTGDPQLVVLSEQVPLSTRALDFKYDQENCSHQPSQTEELILPDSSHTTKYCASEFFRTGNADPTPDMQTVSSLDIKEEEADFDVNSDATETICKSSYSETELKSETGLSTLPHAHLSRKQEELLQLNGISTSPHQSGDDGGAISNHMSYHCRICKKEFRTKGYLRNHFRTHANVMSPHRKTDLHYSVHIEEDSGNDQLNMPSSSTTSDLDTSIDESSSAAAATSLVCRYCKRDFKSEGRLRYHYLNTHSFPNIPGLENLHTDTSVDPPAKKKIKQQYSTVQQPHQSESRYRIMHAQATRENQRTFFENSPAGLAEDIDENPYRCSYCSKAFRTEGYLRNHLRSHATLGSAFGMDFREMGSGDIEMFGGGNGTSFKCQYCEREFRSKGYLRNHLRTHTADK